MMPLVLVGFAIMMDFFVPAVFRFLWNITVPEVFGLRTIRYWQAFRLLLKHDFRRG